MKTKYNTEPLSEVEWDTCWMAIKYAMNGQTICTAMLPRELLRAYYYRWDDEQRRTIARILRDNLDDMKRAYGDDKAYFGDKNIDHPDWMQFLLTLDPKAHCTVTTRDGKTTAVVECIEYEGKYYPISGSQKWWDGVGELYIAAECIKSVKSK